MTVHDFAASMAYADQPGVLERVTEILARDMGAVRVVRASREDDKRGVDFWAYLKSGMRQGVDIKRRKSEWADLFLELVSSDVRGTVGWTKRDDSISDYVLFLWPASYRLVPFPMLRATLHRLEEKYRTKYGTHWAKSRFGEADWRTENVGVPEGRLFRDMFGIAAPIGVPLTEPRKCLTCLKEHAIGTHCEYEDDASADAFWKDIAESGL